MSDEDDGLDVEPVDTSVLDETVATTGLLAHPGWRYTAATLSPTMDDFADEFQTDELLELPHGIREVADEDLEDELEVEVNWVDREDDDGE